MSSPLCLSTHCSTGTPITGNRQGNLKSHLWILRANKLCCIPTDLASHHNSELNFIFSPLMPISSLWKHNYLCRKTNSFKFYKIYARTSKFLFESQIATGHAEAHELHLNIRWHITSLRSQTWKQKTVHV